MRTKQTNGTGGTAAGSAGARRRAWGEPRGRGGAGARAAAGAFQGSGARGPGAAGTAYRTSVATVTRQTLTSQSSLSGTLADSGAYTVVNQATGTITWLPPS